MNTPTQTPLTDAEEFICVHARRIDGAAEGGGEIRAVSSKFARQLERETATLHAQLGEAREEVTKLKAEANEWPRIRLKREYRNMPTEGGGAWALECFEGVPVAEHELRQARAQIARMKMREGELLVALKKAEPCLELALDRATWREANLPAGCFELNQSNDLKFALQVARAALQSVAKEGEQ